jgi:phosphatidylinositol alpha-1,6-mannosyltransferase
MWLKKLILREAAVVITISNYTKKVLLKLGVDPSKIVIVSPGVNPNRFNPSINPIKVVKKHSIKGKKVILTVGRLAGQERYKGQDMVIRAMPKIVAQLPDTIYILVGDGEDRPRLKKLVQELKLEDIVIFAGQVSNEELPSYYSACDAFVMCSREIQNEYRQKKTEGFGIVFLEASACGKPVIGGRSGGIEDAVIDGETGILVDPNNIDEIAETVIKLLTGDTLAQRLGRQGRDRVVNELSWDKVAAKIGEVVHNLR